ncbi:hypothetical protein GLW03_01705 [Halobacillus halophilus]|uniref:hypothetical protein n=1 Tax=Halobacillus halophilus TaxID=1570 RepID=UPI0013700028|nr:hypothetical protein [Halobacillus halophilus]MYL28523.1 hypothetical protein [Halobacillus halophilus]
MSWNGRFKQMLLIENRMSFTIAAGAEKKKGSTGAADGCLLEYEKESPRSGAPSTPGGKKEKNL